MMLLMKAKASQIFFRLVNRTTSYDFQIAHMLESSLLLSAAQYQLNPTTNSMNSAITIQLNGNIYVLRRKISKSPSRWGKVKKVV
ncbi:hypothetical protein SAMN05421868_13475 [Paenibacillus naphthalenovorans]|nr:hypothetical protein SAMN05421868_13475 [Paenibacillus naphthalenovorans]